MTKVAEAILRRAVRLSPVERAELIGALYRTFDPQRRDRMDAKWAEEVESRVAAYDAGRIPADSADAVFRRINRR